MTTMTAPAVTYRKTGKGEWVAYGPASIITAGATVTVTKRDGSTKAEYIASTGRPFTADGRQMVYGYIGTAPAASLSGCVANPQYCPRACKTGAEHEGRQAETARKLASRPRALVAEALTGRCKTCRCHTEDRAGQPGSILYDGCDRCGCHAA